MAEFLADCPNSEMIVDNSLLDCPTGLKSRFATRASVDVVSSISLRRLIMLVIPSAIPARNDLTPVPSLTWVVRPSDLNKSSIAFDSLLAWPS